jgi:chromate reductase
LAGSPRRASLHRDLVRAARELALEGVAIEPYEKLGDLPFFNQDVDDEGDPAPVRELKEKVREADAVLIATPEYENVIPGVLTTALDWALRSPSPLRHKPVGIVGASSGGAGTARGQMVLRQIVLHAPHTSCPNPRCSSPTLARSSTWRQAT